MKRFFAALAALIFLSAPTYAQQTKDQLNSEVSANFPDNSSGLITPAILRTTVNDIIASFDQALRVNAQNGTTYAFTVGDYGYLVTFSNANPVAVSLAQATGSFATWNAKACNQGAGAVTITPSVSTIGGGATLVLQQGQCRGIVSDGANYQLYDGTIKPVTCSASNWVNAVTSSIVPTCSQPAFTDISGTVAAAQVATATITGQTVNNSPNTSNDYFLYFSAADNAVRKCTVGACTAAGVAGVSSLNGLTGALSVAAGNAVTVTPSGANVTVAVNMASKSDMQTATATNVSVDPAQTQNHPGVAKTWAYVAVAGGIATLGTHYNVTSVGWVSAGVTTVNFTTAFSSATTYVCTANSASSAQVVATPARTSASQITVETRNMQGFADVDNDYYVACFGTQ